jgi:hypothetical protein
LQKGLGQTRIHSSRGRRSTVYVPYKLILSLSTNQKDIIMAVTNQKIIQQRRDICRQSVTLDGKPAVIGGVYDQFAQIGTLETLHSVEFSWQTVDRIIRTKGGAFYS